MCRCERTCDWMEFMYWYSANTVEGRVTELNCDTAKAIEHIATLDETIRLINSVSTDDDRMRDLVIACRAIQLMNRVCLKIKGVEGYQDKVQLLYDVEEWLRDYRAAWLRENKLSQLDLIDRFMHEVAIY